MPPQQLGELAARERRYFEQGADPMAKVTDPINIGPIQLKKRIVAAPLLAVGIGERDLMSTLS